MMTEIEEIVEDKCYKANFRQLTFTVADFNGDNPQFSIENGGRQFISLGSEEGVDKAIEILEALKAQID